MRGEGRGLGGALTSNNPPLTGADPSVLLKSTSLRRRRQPSAAVHSAAPRAALSNKLPGDVAGSTSVSMSKKATNCERRGRRPLNSGPLVSVCHNTVSSVLGEAPRRPSAP